MAKASAEGLPCAEGFDGIHFAQMNVVRGILGSREAIPTRELQCWDVGVLGRTPVSMQKNT